MARINWVIVAARVGDVKDRPFCAVGRIITLVKYELDDRFSDRNGGVITGDVCHWGSDVSIPCGLVAEDNLS